MTIPAVVGRRVALVWVVLVGATIVSWILGTDHGGAGHRTASLLVILVAFVKLRLVGLHFMELRDAPPALRGIFEGYCVVVCGLVLGLYLAG